MSLENKKKKKNKKYKYIILYARHKRPTSRAFDDTPLRPGRVRRLNTTARRRRFDRFRFRRRGRRNENVVGGRNSPRVFYTVPRAVRRTRRQCGDDNCCYWKKAGNKKQKKKNIRRDCEPRGCWSIQTSGLVVVKKKTNK